MKSIIRHEDKFELELAEDVGWESFNAWAKAFVKLRKGKVTRKISGPDAHLWEISISNISFSLCFVDFPDTVWIETKEVAGEEILKEIESELGEANHT